MDEAFREYHQFTDSEFKQLWKECLFVFDTNTLLNMYRYSRKTVAAYTKVLNELKERNQLWIPYQVGYEFFENRIDVIREFEKSYDEILSLLNKAKADVETKYKNHPFLDLEEIKTEMTKGLSKTEEKIRQAKAKHPKWLKKDDVLAELDKVFQGCIGDSYEPSHLKQIRAEGQKRYDGKVPPGFKDERKTEDKKFGDLILWFQIIDQARAVQKPIIFITGDVKEDWWLQKDGGRIMPLPQLKKELLDKSGVSFHMYTADQFLALYQSDEKSEDDHSDAVKEVRKIRELEERRRLSKDVVALETNAASDPALVGRYYSIYIYAFELLQRVVDVIHACELESPQARQIEYLFRRIGELRSNAVHEYQEEVQFRVLGYLEEIQYLLQKILTIESEKFSRSTYEEMAEQAKRLNVFLRDFKQG